MPSILELQSPFRNIRWHIWEELERVLWLGAAASMLCYSATTRHRYQQWLRYEAWRGLVVLHYDPADDILSRRIRLKRLGLHGPLGLVLGR
jgi:hypothetical protein